ncbi:PAS domain-containing protein [Methylobacterium sp. P1-11]|uniref:PAS domain-containing protein n=1 Tax=Methylobacterium sp. P1-11 TaxID=2024616 RepID=UPI001FEE7D9B|nr:PAS domain-containing protein [Methylobacterium sp. P1-11]
MTPTASATQPGLAAAFATWERQPALSAALGAPDSLHLVVDPSAGRILYASEAAAPFAEALAGPSLGHLIHQIVTAAAGDATPRLARLRLGLRRIAPPVLCWLARGEQADGRPAILVIATGPVATARSRPVRHAELPPAERVPPRLAPAAPLRRDDRFLWRIDATGVLTTLTGPEALVGLVGQRWQDLAASGRLSGADAVLAALHEGRTFRGEPALLNGGTGPFRVDLSGAPLGRGDAAFAGFGLIRSMPANTSVPLAPAEPAPEAATGARADAAHATVSPMSVEADMQAAVDPEPVAAPLSNDEHAAFREIARALGARYAGDEAESGSGTPKVEGGAVMPFPTPQTNPAEVPAEPDDAAAETAAASADSESQAVPLPDSELLAGLPLPVLLHRDGTIVAANRALLDLTGLPDLPSLARTGLSRLLPGVTPTEALAAPTRRTTVTTADGAARPVELLASASAWAGMPATCLVIRPVDEADVVDALTAERLARAAQIERTVSAEAALDALETGVVTVDGAGRIVALNRAAAGLFGCDPREIVGSSFVSLFDRQSVLTVADGLRGAPPRQRTVLLAGEPVSLTVAAAQAQGRHVALLARIDREAVAPSAVDSPAHGPGRGGALGRLDTTIREPLSGMIDLAAAMLKEPFGPLGDARYRGCLAEIKASGEMMLERVGKLLDLAAVEAGALRLEPQALDLNDVVADCVARLQGEAARGRIVMRTSFSTDIGDLEADERSVSRAASLVIENAIRRSAAGSQIIVSTGSAERAAIALRVRDTGAGHVPRVEAPKGEVEEGLALPRALVEANGGRLQFSARPEDGTLVEIIMPTRRAANG